jgi:hypothetical protein
MIRMWLAVIVAEEAIWPIQQPLWTRPIQKHIDSLLLWRFARNRYGGSAQRFQSFHLYGKFTHDAAPFQSPTRPIVAQIPAGQTLILWAVTVNDVIL